MVHEYRERNAPREAQLHRGRQRNEGGLLTTDY